MKSLFLAASLAALTVPLTAQDTSKKATSHPKSPFQKPTVQQRKKHQQKRIAHGVQSGKLTTGEAASLERKEAGLNAEERDLREDNRGRLTSADRAKLQHQQNRVSKAVSHDQHNATVAKAHPKSTAGQHANNQQHGAAQLKTSQLTTRQAAHIETKETSLHREIHSDREQDGKPTPEDQTNPQQNKNTHQIRLKKHNARMF
ncbi:MAG: hypothetical protein WAQ52_18640 [Terriglobales bacterium]